MSEDRLTSVTSSETAYKWLIDEIADAGRIEQTAARIREHGHHLRRNDADFPLDESDQKQRDFLLSLTTDQREVVIAMLANARQAVAHDIAALLNDCVSLEEMRIEVKGHKIGESPFWSFHHDLLYRLENEPWPED